MASDLCACGLVKNRRSANCRKCRKPLRVKSCVSCGREFKPRFSSTVCCSQSCQIKRTVACAKAKALDKTERGERLRQRRRRASEKRRARGWRARFGRWRRICARDGWVCWLCSNPIDPLLLHPNRMSGTADHVVPLVDGGTDEDSNLRAAHYSCNCKRGAGNRRARMLERAA
jgi:hypothetical protein